MTSSSSPQPPSKQPPRWEHLREYFFYPLLVAIITLLLTLGVQWLLGPPADSTVTQLMDQEIQIARTHNMGLLASIYDSQAVVMDAGCSTPNQGTVWPGLTQIMTRYSSLPQFTSLAHIDPQISWYPHSFLAAKASASASTLGSIPSLTSAAPQVVRGNEHWTFAKINGQWLITSFTYNLCQP